VSAAPEATRRRAACSLRWYPPGWRARYGEEFVELLVAEMAEQPHSAGRALDVARSGVLARLAAAGIAGQPLEPEEGARASLAAFGCAVTLFVTMALALWAQVTIGWQWSAPDTGATSSAMVTMSVAAAGLASALVLCALPVMGAALRRVVRGPQRRVILWPLCACLGGSIVLAVGTHHFANGWPGTGGHPWAHQGIVPGGVAAWSWAATLFVTSYWVHPAALGRFPGAEVAWMFVSPAALVATVVGGTKVVRRLALSARLLRFERKAGSCVAGFAAAFLAGAALWTLDGGPGPRDLFHVGAIDLVELAVMVVALGLAGLCRSRPGRVATPRTT
jgi:hypothetical protein